MVEKVKEWTQKWNPFNSYKLLAQVPKWQKIKRGEKIPAPTLVTIDPMNSCNYDCIWCNADYILGRCTGKISNSHLDQIADFLPEWGVESVCIAGGGEPLLHTYTGKFIEKLGKNGIKSGIVTNGRHIDKHANYLVDYCDWVGVSMDVGTNETLRKLKGAKKGDFEKTIKNIEQIAKAGGKLNSSGQGHGVSYKFLLHPGNVHEVYQSAVLAKEIGCRNFHLRPFGTPWDKLGDSLNQPKFSYSDIQLFNEQIEKARVLEDHDFGVFGVTHKFDGDFRKSNEFNNCHAVFMTGVFMPPTSKEKGFDFGLCCDRRGDDGLTIKNLVDTKEIENFWGSKEHWEIFDKINPKKCPRCTYQPHNQIFEQVIEKDNMTLSFI